MMCRLAALPLVVQLISLYTLQSFSSLLSIVSAVDISVGFRPLHALLVGERIVQFEI